LSGNLVERISGDATGGSENSRPSGGTGATPFVAGNLPADRQERSSRPPQEEHPTPSSPHASLAGDNYVHCA